MGAFIYSSADKSSTKLLTVRAFGFRGSDPLEPLDMVVDEHADNKSVANISINKHIFFIQIPP